MAMEMKNCIQIIKIFRGAQFSFEKNYTFIFDDKLYFEFTADDSMKQNVDLCY